MGHDAFNDDLVKVVRPYIDAHYRTVADRDHRAIAGLSMGGLHTLNMRLLKDLQQSPIGSLVGQIRNTIYLRTTVTTVLSGADQRGGPS
jgi:S-formylglutathione hydrolase FrmB